MPQRQSTPRQRRNRYRRARLRHFIFTAGPDHLTGGRITRRHLTKDILIRQIDVASPTWPAAFDGLRIGHVSDFHLGRLLPLEKAMAAVQQLADQEPDFIACTGDVVDLHHHDAAPLLERLGRIDAPLGAALVLGNHDELHCSDRLTEMALDAGLIVLRNEVVRIHHHGHRLIVAGIDWARSAVRCATLIDRTCTGFVHLLLAHNPKAFLGAADREIPLTLAGHTHGGQIAMKDRPNTNLSLTHRRSAGLFSSGPSRLFVTTGVGAWFPLRVNCPPEIAILTMRHEEATNEGPHASDRRRRRQQRRRRARAARRAGQARSDA